MPKTETEVVPKTVSVGMDQDQNQMRYPFPCSLSRTTNWLNNKEPCDRIVSCLFVGLGWVFLVGFLVFFAFWGFGGFFGLGFLSVLKSYFYG